MLTLFAVSALAGSLVIDCEVPVDISIDQVLQARLYSAGRVVLPLSTGAHELVVFVAGEGTTVPLQVPASGDVRVSVGRNGVTSPTSTVATDAGPMHLELRSVAREDVIVVVGTERYPLPRGGSLGFDLEAGRHHFGVRNGAGTVIWSDGALELAAGGDVVVHIADGRPPEIIGPGATFVPGGR